jgi:AcrR family transcriptional regulator
LTAARRNLGSQSHRKAAHVTTSAIPLRERKKTRTRQTIQAHAVRLFKRQGYEATTVDQIADAAEVSPSTFFRYFSTKEAVLFEKSNFAEVLDYLSEQPAGLSTLDAVEAAIRMQLDRFSPAEMKSFQERNRLIFSTPELKGPYLTHLVNLTNMLSEGVARRTGKDVDDLDVRTFAWAVQGALTAVFTRWAEFPGEDLNSLLASACQFLQSGLRI